MSRTSKIKILGAGPTGALTAIALAQAGSYVYILDPKTIKILSSSNRAYALTHSSRYLLKKLNLWDKIYPFLTAFNRLTLQDQEIRKVLSFTSQDLPVELRSQDEIGWIIDHRNLMELLFNTINRSKYICSSFGLINDHFKDYDLLIAADGANSNSRKKWGIKSFEFNYSQSCITAKVLIRGAIKNGAYEIFRADGPLAVLPMGGAVFQIVWSSPTFLANQMVQHIDSVFLDKLAAILPNNLQPDELLEKPSVFPLQLSVALNFAQRRKLLLGESAHRCHPVGGQGLNLCWRDVNELMSLVKEVNQDKIKISKVPFIYRRNRLHDVIITCIFTDLLVRIFSNNNQIMFYIKRFLFYLLYKLSILKRLTLKIMSCGLMTSLNVCENDTKVSNHGNY